MSEKTSSAEITTFISHCLSKPQPARIEISNLFISPCFSVYSEINPVLVVRMLLLFFLCFGSKAACLQKKTEKTDYDSAALKKFFPWIVGILSTNGTSTGAV